MKKLYGLLLVPALMLPSCGAKNISNEKALEIIEAIHNNAGAIEEAEAYEMTMNLKEEYYEEEIGKSRQYGAKFHFWMNKNGAAKAEVKGNFWDKDDAEYYIVKIPSQKYEEITYVKKNNLATKEQTESVFIKAENNYYDTQTAETIANVVSLPLLIKNSLMDPYDLSEVLVIDDANIEEGDSLTRDIKYYSTNDKNLTIKSNIKRSLTMNGSELRETELYYEVVYENLQLSSIKASEKTNYGLKQDITAKISTKDQAFRIVVPENYEQLIVYHD